MFEGGKGLVNRIQRIQEAKIRLFHKHKNDDDDNNDNDDGSHEASIHIPARHEGICDEMFVTV